jgi:hypothetical protein
MLPIPGSLSGLFIEGGLKGCGSDSRNAKIDVRRDEHRSINLVFFFWDLGREDHYENPIHYSGRIHSYIMFLEIIRIQKYG